MSSQDSFEVQLSGSHSLKGAWNVLLNLSGIVMLLQISIAA